ncbi:nose resistant to fluoxetine protein 6-like [Culicoides brevitarsis]|uniref:nose resistant to fluoxetine protein 6-like n=1 Tax=Culicoides brevitarsis TaxID=469753 RepID=UPI00307C4255
MARRKRKTGLNSRQPNTTRVNGQRIRIATLNVGMTEYYRMPPKYETEDYDRCLYSTSHYSLYCGVKTIIKPDWNNEYWNLIWKYSKNTKQNYRHDIILHGFCVTWCLERLSNGNYDEFYLPEFKTNRTVYGTDPTLLNDTLYFRELYGRDVNKCINIGLKRKYGLMGYSSIEFCNSNQEVAQYDFLDYFFMVILVAIVATVTAGTYFDKSMNPKETMDHYKKDVENVGLGTRVLLSFSLPRNWYRLVTPSKTTIGRDLRYVQGLRVVTMFGVVYGHVFLGYNFAPAINPEYIEQRYHSIWSMVMLNGMTVVQTFFTISGFLLTVQFVEMTQQFKRQNWNPSYFWIAIFYRYIRLTPVYALMVLFDATWLVRTNSGPGWKRTAWIERSYCRRNWWTNLLYINNYVNVPETCLPQSWFLSADYQLFAVALIVLIVIWRYPKKMKVIMGSCLAVAYAIPFFVTYFGEYEGTYIVPPEERKFMNQHREFRDNYSGAHLSAGNYFVGILIGLMYHDFKKRNLDVRKNKWMLLTWYIYPFVGYLMVLSSYLFYAYDFEKPSIWMSLYSVVTKNMWGAFGAILMFGFVGKLGSVITTIFNSPIFQPLGRIVYCIYLVHFSVARYLAGDVRGKVYISGTNIFNSVLSTYLLSTVFGLILCLMLEFPMTALLKEILKKSGKNLRDEEAEDEREKIKAVTPERDEMNNIKDTELTKV